MQLNGCFQIKIVKSCWKTIELVIEFKLHSKKSRILIRNRIKSNIEIENRIKSRIMLRNRIKSRIQIRSNKKSHTAGEAPELTQRD